MKKDASTASFDWDFSAPPSPQLSNNPANANAEEDDIGLTFTVNQTSNQDSALQEYKAVPKRNDDLQHSNHQNPVASISNRKLQR